MERDGRDREAMVQRVMAALGSNARRLVEAQPLRDSNKQSGLIISPYQEEAA